MKIKIFGKKNCSICEATKKKIEFFINEWGMNDKVNIIFYDLDSVDGLTEGTLIGATDVPTTVVTKGDTEVTRWVQKAPESEELKSSLS